MKYSILIAILAAGFAAGQAPDNTQTNKRDRNDGTATADKQQKMGKTDTELVKNIRQSVYANKNFSTYAHNVKIVAQNGRVTLRGPVRTQEERDEIQRMAESVAGTGHVTNQLEVTPAKKN